MTQAELKFLQLSGQHLISPADKLTVVRDLCGVQAQFMSNAVHSLRIRCRDFSPDTVADGLCKNWTIRGTVHVFAEDDLPLFIRANGGRDYRSESWDGYTTWRRPDGELRWKNDGKCERTWTLLPERQKHFARIIINAVAERPRTRDELKALCTDGGMTETETASMFDPWGGGIRELCERGFMNYVVSEEKAYAESPVYEPMDDETAKLELARRYFTHIAPATVHDAQYFFHTTAKEVRGWLDALPVKSTVVDGREYFYIENGATTGDIPDCVFLAGFDQLLLGHEKKESLFLPAGHMRKIFNLAGIVMPSVLLRGRVVGGWKKTRGKLAVTLFEDVGADGRRTVREAASRTWDDLSKVEL